VAWPVGQAACGGKGKDWQHFLFGLKTQAALVIFPGKNYSATFKKI
jgi:hypothetical protein